MNNNWSRHSDQPFLICLTLENYVKIRIKKIKKNCPIGSIAINYQTCFKTLYRYSFAVEEERQKRDGWMKKAL